MHDCNPSTYEAEMGGSQVRGQPQQLRETLSQNKKLNKIKGLGCSSKVECPWFNPQ